MGEREYIFKIVFQISNTVFEKYFRTENAINAVRLPKAPNIDAVDVGKGLY